MVLRRSRLFIGGLIAFSLVLISLVFWSARNSEPQHEGKRLGEWLESLDPHEAKMMIELGMITGQGNRNKKTARVPVTNSVPHEAAKQAIKAMGTNAVPFLISELEILDTPARRKREDFFRKYLVPQATPLDLRQQRAMAAFYVLAEEGRAAVPALIEVARDPHHSEWVRQALVAIGRDSVVPLTECLSDADPAVRKAAAQTLGVLGADSVPSIPQLVQAMKDRDKSVASAAIQALAWMRTDRDGSVRVALREAQKDPQLKEAASHALTRFR